MDVRDYEVVIRHLPDEDGGGYLATVTELPGCMTDGETRAEALERIEDAMLTYLSRLRGSRRAKLALRSQRIEDAMLTWVFTAKEIGRKVPAPRRVHA